MEDNDKKLSVADDVVVSLDYTLTVDGEVVDSSEEDEPIEFLQGRGGIISGLEKALYGMVEGESKQVAVPAKDAYGEYDSEAVMDVPRSEFPPEIPLKPGVELQMRDQDGDVVHAQIVSVSKSSVKLDFNHPLAGKDLKFDVTIAGLRAATAEELDHGHVHGAHGHDHDDDDDDEFEGDEVEFIDLEEFEDELDGEFDLDDDDYLDEDEAFEDDEDYKD